jgi:hypothetical protein
MRIPDELLMVKLASAAGLVDAPVFPTSRLELLGPRHTYPFPLKPLRQAQVKLVPDPDLEPGVHTALGSHGLFGPQLQ